MNQRLYMSENKWVGLFHPYAYKWSCMGEFDWFYRNPSRQFEKVCVHQRLFYLVGNFNHLELGTIILIVFDFQGKRALTQITSTTGR